MDINKFEASLLKAMEGMQEAVAAMKVNDFAPYEGPVSTLTSDGAQTSDFSDEAQRAIDGEIVNNGIAQARAHMGRLWVLTEPNHLAEAILEVTTGTVHNATALAKVANALCHWHGEAPSLEQLRCAISELNDCHPGGEWQYIGFDFRLFNEPSQGEFWNGDAYATPYAAERDGAVYSTDDKVPSREVAVMIGTVASEVWGHEYSNALAIAFKS